MFDFLRLACNPESLNNVIGEEGHLLDCIIVKGNVYLALGALSSNNIAHSHCLARNRENVAEEVNPGSERDNRSIVLRKVLGDEPLTSLVTLVKARFVVGPRGDLDLGQAVWRQSDEDRIRLFLLELLTELPKLTDGVLARNRLWHVDEATYQLSCFKVLFKCFYRLRLTPVVKHLFSQVYLSVFMANCVNCYQVLVVILEVLAHTLIVEELCLESGR